eukprot:2463815-Ditylum_brightwellii.AAC.1
MLNTFLLLLFDGKRVKSKQVDLIEDYFTVKEEEVCKSVRYFHEYGQDYDIQNLQWSYPFLYNSCSDDVRQKVVEKSRCSQYITKEVLLSSFTSWKPSRRQLRRLHGV